MRLLLLSRGVGALPEFLDRSTGSSAENLRLGYLTDAAGLAPEQPFAVIEKLRVAELGYQIREMSATQMTALEFKSALDDVDALYVAGGNTFVLLSSLSSTGLDHAIIDRVSSGLPFIGSSAGSIIVGDNIEPASFLDDPLEAPEFSEYTGLKLIDGVIIPHADGTLAPYSPDVIAQIFKSYSTTYNLIPICDDEALLVDSFGSRIISSPL